MARAPPELVDALRALARIARALADYLEAVAEVEEEYGVSIEDLLRRAFSEPSALTALPTSALVALYQAAARIQEASRALRDPDALPAEEKKRVAAALREAADRVDEALRL